MTVESSIKIEFKISCEDVDSFLSVELDAVLNEGRTCFLYGEKVFFRVYHSPRLTITTDSSAGIIFFESADNEGSLEEDISFVSTDEASTSKFILSLDSYTWYGRSLGLLLQIGETSIRASNSGLAIADVHYTTQYDVYSILLSDQGLESFPVLILVTGSV